MERGDGAHQVVSALRARSEAEAVELGQAVPECLPGGLGGAGGQRHAGQVLGFGEGDRAQDRPDGC